jgi:hypothetical protein
LNFAENYNFVHPSRLVEALKFGFAAQREFVVLDIITLQSGLVKHQLKSKAYAQEILEIDIQIITDDHTHWHPPELRT